MSIDRTVGNDTSFVVTWDMSTSLPNILLTDPKGGIYLQTDFEIDNTNIRMAQLKIGAEVRAEISLSFRIYVAAVVNVTFHFRKQASSINKYLYFCGSGILIDILSALALQPQYTPRLLQAHLLPVQGAAFYDCSNGSPYPI